MASIKPWFLLFALLVGCTGSATGSAPQPSDDDSPSETDEAPSDNDGTSDNDATDTDLSDTDDADADTDTDEPPSDCVEDDDCAGGGRCRSSTGGCVDGAVGSPCDDEGDCVPANTCDTGVCAACLGFACALETDVVTYAPTTEVLANPERGFAHWPQLKASSPTSITATQLNQYRTNDKMSVLIMYFFMDLFAYSLISDEYLTLVRDQFEVVREAGFKIVPRFIYTRTLNAERVPPFYDSTLAWMLQHIEQLAPILNDHRDIVLTLQAGLIGVWGEWAFSDEFGYDTDTRYSETSLSRRSELLHAWLDALPGVNVSLREPANKALIFGVDMPDGALTAETAYDGSDLARVGHHNDCFLANSAYSTFYYDVANQWEYWRRDSLYSIVGGETCNDNSTYTNCTSALTALAEQHWTYLHLDYHPDAVQRWRDEGCFDEIRDRLGYRLELTSGTFATRVRSGEPFAMELVLVNEGFAAPVGARSVELVFRDQTTGSIVVEALDVDPRFWLPGDTVTVAASVPLTLAPGSYDVLLALADPASALHDDPRYSIRFANDGTWEPESGYNVLGVTLVVE